MCIGQKKYVCRSVTNMDNRKNCPETCPSPQCQLHNGPVMSRRSEMREPSNVIRKIHAATEQYVRSSRNSDTRNVIGIGFTKERIDIKKDTFLLKQYKTMRHILI